VTDDDKIVLELRKLRWELSFWARAAAVAVPIAAFFVAASQTWIAVQDSRSKDVLALRDLELKRIENGVKLVEFTTAQTAMLLSADAEKRSQALTYASTLLPAEQACIVINAVIIASPGHADFVAPAQRIRELIVKHYKEGSPPAVCTDATIFETQSDIAVAVTQAAQVTQVAVGAAPIPSAAPVEPEATQAPFGCALPLASKALPLVVYYQIVQKEDRPNASRIGFEIPDTFPSAGIEYVATTDVARQSPQVRYYYPDQQNAAESLACMLTAAYAKITGHKPRVGDVDTAFKTLPLVGRYKDLPPHRIEVWFPRILPPV
jgi:hypothetical protein